MLSPNDLLIRSTTREHLEFILQQRDSLLEKARAEQDLHCLQQVSIIDKKNIAFLVQARNELGCTLNNIGKIKGYVSMPG